MAPGALLAAPELLDGEVLNASRRLKKAGAAPANHGTELPEQLRGLRVRKYRHDLLVDGIWALRDNLTAYDAAYVVLARLLNASLVTRDAKSHTHPRSASRC